MSIETWKPRRFVEEFQKRAGLLIDGKPGPQTQMALEFVPELPPGRIYPAVPELPEHLRTTPTPINPADIRPGDVFRAIYQATCVKALHGTIWTASGDEFSIEDKHATWHLVSRPDPDAVVVEALLAASGAIAVKVGRDSAADDVNRAYAHLAALREQGWDVVRRAES